MLRQYEGELGIFEYDDAECSIGHSTEGEDRLFWLGTSKSVTVTGILRSTRRMFADATLPEGFKLYLGDFIDEDNGWEFMNWAQENITPTGKYQAVLSRDIQMVLDACNPSKKNEIAIYSAKQNYGLFYLQAMVPKDRKELIGFMESLPVCKEITCTNKTYYVVESWLDEYDLYLMKHGIHSGMCAMSVCSSQGHLPKSISG